MVKFIEFRVRCRVCGQSFPHELANRSTVHKTCPKCKKLTSDEKTLTQLRRNKKWLIINAILLDALRKPSIFSSTDYSKYVKLINIILKNVTYLICVWIVAGGRNMDVRLRELLMKLFNIIFLSLLFYLCYQWGYNDCLTKVIQAKDGLFQFCLQTFYSRLIPWK